MFKPGATLTVDSASATLAAGLQAIAAGQAEIDVSDVAVVDSSAVAVLLAWQRAAAEKNITMRFGTLQTSLQSLVDLYGAASLLGTPESASDRHS